MNRLLLLLSALLLLPFGSSLARTWHVAPDGTGDAPTIQAGIDSASIGDTLLLADGTYTGVGNRDISYKGKPVVVRSQSSMPQSCIIHCGAQQRGFAFVSNEGLESVLEGVTVREGCDAVGGGIYCSGSSPTIKNVILRDNYGWNAGGGMYCEEGSSPFVANTIFLSNGAMDGGGLCCIGSNPHLSGVEFRGNYTGLPGTGGGIACIGGSSPELTDVDFIDNSCQLSGGGIACWDTSTPVLTNALFWANRAMSAGGGISCGGGITMTQCTFVLNSSGMFGSAIACEGSPPLSIERSIFAYNFGSVAIVSTGGDCPELSCCDVFGNFMGDWVGCIAGQYGVNGNFSLNPLFCDSASGDFSLEACSPCLPENHPAGYSCESGIGPLGPGCPCSHGVEATSWGAVKAIYR